MTIRGVHRNW